jgi:hypothetical protein
MSILENAVDSIAIGLEDYQSTDERRIISSTRNIFAGILLLFKYKLAELSPPNSDEALIKEKILPVIDAGQVNWVGKGGKTVDVRAIKDRFQSLGIELDWKRLEKINKYRNDIEHYYSNLKHESIQQLISDSFLIIREFISVHLCRDPKELLGEEAWAVLVEVNEVYEREKLECVEKIKNLVFYSNEICLALAEYSCNECGSGLIAPLGESDEAIEEEFECRSCNENYVYENIINRALPEYFRDAIYFSHKEGDYIPLTGCPHCLEDVYLYHEKICASCGETAEHECDVCGSTMNPEEISEDPICSSCLYVMEKDD